MFWTTVGLMVTLTFGGVSTLGKPGELTDADINKPEVRDALNFAITQLNNENPVYTSKVEKVLKAQTQVVAGILYKFEVILVITGCKRSVEGNLCVINNNPELIKPYKCTFEVLSQPWMTPAMTTKKVCE